MRASPAHRTFAKLSDDGRTSLPLCQRVEISVCQSPQSDPGTSRRGSGAIGVDAPERRHIISGVPLHEQDLVTVGRERDEREASASRSPPMPASGSTAPTRHVEHGEHVHKKKSPTLHKGHEGDPITGGRPHGAQRPPRGKKAETTGDEHAGPGTISRRDAEPVRGDVGDGGPARRVRDTRRSIVGRPPGASAAGNRRPGSPRRRGPGATHHRVTTRVPSRLPVMMF